MGEKKRQLPFKYATFSNNMGRGLTQAQVKKIISNEEVKMKRLDLKSPLKMRKREVKMDLTIYARDFKNNQDHPHESLFEGILSDLRIPKEGWDDIEEITITGISPEDVEF